MASWFGYLGALSIWFQRSENPAILIGGLGFAMLAFLLVTIYLRFRNIEK